MRSSHKPDPYQISASLLHEAVQLRLAVAAADDIVDIRSCIILHGEVAAVIAQAADLGQKRAHIVLTVSFAADRHGHGIADGRIGDGDIPDSCAGDGRSPAFAVEAGICRGSLIWIDNAAQIRHRRHPDAIEASIKRSQYCSEQSNTDVYFKGRRCHFHYANVMAKEWYSNGNQPNNKG